jgi:hypothetical protein
MADVNHTAPRDIGGLDYATVERRVEELLEIYEGAQA